MRDLEEDPELRSGVLMYKAQGLTTNKSKQQQQQPQKDKDNEAMGDADDMEDDDEEDPDFPDVMLDELVDDVSGMNINAGAGAGGDDDGDDDVELDDWESNTLFCTIVCYRIIFSPLL